MITAYEVHCIPKQNDLTVLHRLNKQFTDVILDSEKLWWAYFYASVPATAMAREFTACLSDSCECESLSDVLKEFLSNLSVHFDLRLN